VQLFEFRVTDSQAKGQVCVIHRFPPLEVCVRRPSVCAAPPSSDRQSANLYRNSPLLGRRASGPSDPARKWYRVAA
jgi:hypothetical protein